MASPIDRFLTDAASDTHAAARSWLSAARIEANRRAELELALTFARPSTPERHRLRLIELGGALQGHAVLAGARTRLVAEYDDSGEVIGTRPRRFAAVEHRTFGFNAPEILLDLARAMRAEFPESQETRVYRASGGAADVEALAKPPPGLTLIHHERLLAAPVGQIQRLAPPAGFDRVACVRAGDLSFYDEYAALYGQMLAERPELAPEIPVEPHQDMEEYLRAGLLFLIMVDARRAGVMAALPTLMAGLHGFQVHEKFIYPDFRGHGLASAMQRRFVDALDPSDARIVFGFIHPKNVWSLKAAQRDGRIDVGGYTFAALRG